MPLSDGTYQKILQLSEKGESLFHKDAFLEAIPLYREAFDLIPHPKNLYEASSWLLAAIGDCLFYENKFQEAIEELKYAEACEGGLNPFIWLRIGQCYLHLNDRYNAREYLLRAYAMEGKELLAEEGEVYLEAIKDLME